MQLTGLLNQTVFTFKDDQLLDLQIFGYCFESRIIKPSVKQRQS